MDIISAYRNLSENDSNYGGGNGTLDDPFIGRLGSDNKEFAKEIFAKWGGDGLMYLEGHRKQIFSVEYKKTTGLMVNFKGIKGENRDSYSLEEVKDAVNFSSSVGQGLAELIPKK